MKQSLSVVALSINTEQTDFGWDDSELCKQFPGSCWMPILRGLVLKNGIDIQLTRTVREAVTAGEIHPAQVGVIQVDQEPDGRWLLEHGATGITILNGESPQAIPEFYERLSANSESFRFRLFFSGMLERLNSRAVNRKFLFPSYSEEERVRRITQGLEEATNRFSLDGPAFLTLVAANNFWRRTGFDYYRRKPKKLLLPWSNSPEGAHHRWSKRYELHTTRLKAVAYFCKRNRISLFGRRWDSHPIPLGFSRKRILSCWRGPTENKMTTISAAKFNFCSENSAFPGYVTEKIFHAFVAGTVPIYFGAPDIRDFVPETAFIDGSRFKSMRELEKYLDSVSLERYSSYLSAAIDFLRSEDGISHTYESFAQKLLEDVLECATQVR